MKTTKDQLLNRTNGGAGNGPDDVENERKRISEIHEVVALVLKRDGKDFSNEAKRAIQEGASAADFSKAIVFSDRFKSPRFEIGPNVEDAADFGSIKGSLGDLIANHEDFKRMVASGGLARGQSLVINMPNVNYGKLRQRFRASTPTTGLPLTGIDILPQIAELLIQPARVADICTGYATGGSSVRYISERTFSNAAAPTAEGTAKPEQVFDLVEIDSPVRKIAVWTKASDEVLMDHARLQGFLNMKLIHGVELALDTQLINGNGTAPQLLGVMNFGGIQNHLRTTDTHYDAIRKAITLVRKNAFVEPSAIVLNPVDNETLSLEKDTAGQYLAGGARLGSYGQPLGAQDPNAPIWRLKPVVTTAVPAGTAIVAAWQWACEVYWRQGIVVSMTNTDQDDFIKNLITFRVELRAALAVPHPIAVCTVTGL